MTTDLVKTRKLNLIGSATTATLTIGLMFTVPQLETGSQAETCSLLSNTDNIELSGLSSNIPQKKDFISRYKQISESQWFNDAYENKSLGDLIGIDA